MKHVVLALAIAGVLPETAQADEAAIRSLEGTYYHEGQRLREQWYADSKFDIWDDEKLSALIDTYESVQASELRRFKERDFEAYVRFLEADHVMDFEALQRLRTTSAAYRNYEQAIELAYMSVSNRLDELHETRDARETAAGQRFLVKETELREAFIAKLVTLFAER